MGTSARAESAERSFGRLADARPEARHAPAPAPLVDLARSVGNRAFARLVTERAALQRQEGPRSPEPPAPAESTEGARIEGWAAAQDDWGVLDENRTRVEGAQPGATVTLAGKGNVSLSRSDDSLAAVRRGIRHRLMEMVYEWRQPFVDELAATHVASTRLDVQHKMRERLRGLVGALRKGLPDSEKFEYPKGATRAIAGRDVTGADVIASVLAAFQLEGEGAAENVLAGQDFDKAKADALKGIGATDPTTQWCGAFAYVQLAEAGLRSPSGATIAGNPLALTGPPSKGGLDAWFQYKPPVEVKVGADWIDLRKYHEERGSVRLWQVLPPQGPTTRRTARSGRRGPEAARSTTSRRSTSSRATSS